MLMSGVGRDNYPRENCPSGKPPHKQYLQIISPMTKLDMMLKCQGQEL